MDELLKLQPTILYKVKYLQSKVLSKRPHEKVFIGNEVLYILNFEISNNAEQEDIMHRGNEQANFPLLALFLR